MRAMSLAADCASDLTLDEWMAGELDSAQGARIEQHLAGCTRCAERHAVFARKHEAFLAGAPSFDALAARVGRNPPARARAVRLLRWAAAAALVAGCAIALLTLRPAPEPSSTRIKGRPHVGFFVKRGDRISSGRFGQTVQPGDLLRFTYSSDRARYLALINRDQRGASVYYPAGSEAARVPPGASVPLDFGIELDATLGRERIYAVFCPAPFAVEPLRALLEAGSPERIPSDCHVDVIEMNKEPRR